METQPINASGIELLPEFEAMTAAYGGHHESAVTFRKDAVMRVAREIEEQGGRFPNNAIDRLRICLFKCFDADGGAPLKDKFSTRRKADLNDKVYEFACRPGEEAAIQAVLDRFAEEYDKFNRNSITVAEASEIQGEEIPEGVFDERISWMIDGFLKNGDAQHMNLQVRRGDHKRKMEDGTPFHEYIASQVAERLTNRQLEGVRTVGQTGAVKVRLFSSQKRRPGDPNDRDFFVVIPFNDGVLKIHELITVW